MNMGCAVGTKVTGVVASAALILLMLLFLHILIS